MYDLEVCPRNLSTSGVSSVPCLFCSQFGHEDEDGDADSEQKQK